MSESTHICVAQTKSWIEQVIIGLNFCPFAKKEFVNHTIRYQHSEHKGIEEALHLLTDECQLLDANASIETTLIIFELGFANFYDFLDLLALAEDLLASSGYEGTYQLASFHPNYCFAGVSPDDCSNYTNRSPYPTLHLIRESGIEKVLKSYPDPESIPERNIAVATEKGGEYFSQLLNQIKRDNK